MEASVTEEWRKAGERVRNWGRWGDDDQLGTLNLLTPERIAYAATRAVRGRAIQLGIPFDAYGPQSAGGMRRNPVHLMAIDGGDAELAAQLAGWGGPQEAQVAGMYARGPMRFNDDYVMMPLQAATQWDALSHVYYDGLLYNGYPAASVTSLGATRLGIEQVAERGGVVGRGVLLDVARHHGVDRLAAGTVVGPHDLDAVIAAQGVELRPGDILVIRTGWWTRFLETRRQSEWFSGSPGLSWRCAEWLHEHEIAAVALDNPAVEVMRPEDGVMLPLHMLTLRDMGLPLGEIWDLEALGRDCAEDRVYDFLLCAPALRIPGAVGTPISPVAIK
ncbi:cyclase family protein [Nocardia yunnanensis]|uniref:Cyclase family protein n=1 Tax=Nocardia yunnanensis TaxID=2382165 RepID=A0A386ZGR3_9NOCA|nr:cyclase family protein [Nocardia yunnanensis]